MAINSYFIGGHWLLLMFINSYSIVAINCYFINDYWWLFY